MTLTTTNFGLPKPESDEAPNGPLQIGALADAVDDELADIAPSQLTDQTAGKLLIANASGVITGTAMSGDATISSTGEVSLAANSVGSAEIANDAVGSTELADNAVDTAAIQADAVTGAKVADNAIGAEHIAANAVGASEIAADAVGSSEIAAGAIGVSELASSSVTNAAIADGTISPQKMSPQYYIKSIVSSPTIGTTEATIGSLSQSVSAGVWFVTATIDPILATALVSYIAIYQDSTIISRTYFQDNSAFTYDVRMSVTISAIVTPSSTATISLKGKSGTGSFNPTAEGRMLLFKIGD